MDDLENLELLSLVSKVTSEIQNHLGVSDKTLAEFVIAQHVESGGSVGSFQKQLTSMGAEFPQSLIDSVDRLCLTLHPKYKKAVKGSNQQRDHATAGDERSRVFKGLSIPDKDIAFEAQEEEPEVSKLDALDDTFAMLEGLAGNGTSKPKPQPSRKREHESV